MRPVGLIRGAVSVLDRDDIDTDQIIPKQFMKTITRAGLEKYLFHDWASTDPSWDLPPNPILATGDNFGCGSSREHAPWALQDYGFEAIVAPSFAEIFYSNCTKIGLLPIVLPRVNVRQIAEAGEATIDLEARTVSFAGGVLPFEIDEEIRRRLLHGLDDISVTLQHADAIAQYERDRAEKGTDTLKL